MKLSLIVAMSQNRVIGREGGLPWRLSADLRRFKRLTMGHHLLMGRKTYQSIERPLPGRISIVITRQSDLEAPGVLVARNLAQAIQLASHDTEAFVIGGGQIYGQALPLVDRMYVTAVHVDIPGDTYFPEVDWTRWTELESERFPADVKNEYEHTFSVYQRRGT